MEIKECFLVLGVEVTKDEQVIKKAYREKLSVTNPEDNPEGFKRLRAAYEQTLAYAKQTDEEKEEEKDVTASGFWVEKIGEIYGDMTKRRDPECWKELLDDDILLSLEEEENCRYKLLRFLMDHFRLPSDVWKLLGERMHLTQDAAKLREFFPADFINYVVNRCERGEDIEFDRFEGAADAEYDLFLNCYDNCWHALQENQLEQAAGFLEEAAGLHIYHPAMEVCRGNLLLAQGKNAEAADFMRSLYEKHPKDMMVCYHTAETLWKGDQKEEAAKVYLALKEENEKHYMANLRLTEWNYENGNYQEAKKCAENVLSFGSDDDFMELLAKVNSKLERGLELKWQEHQDWEAALELCWCYLQDGRTSEGIRLASKLEKLISPQKEAEYLGLLAKLYVEEAEYEASLTMSGKWEKALEKKLQDDDTEEEKEKDTDRIRQSHLIRMQCYRNLGYKDKEYFAKAIEQIEMVVPETIKPKDIGILLEKAQIYIEMEEYEKSQEITERLIEEYQVYAAAATAMEGYRRQWDAGGVIKYARMCIQYFPDYIRAYEQLGKVYLDLEEQDALKELLAEAEENGIKSAFMEAYRYQSTKKKPPSTEVLDQKLEEFQKNFQDKLDGGETAYYEAGLPLITEYLYWYPGVYMLRRRAVFHRSGQHLQEALDDYERALSDEPGNAYIYNSMSQTYVLLGDYEKALVCLKKAILYGETEWAEVLYYHMARLYMLLNDNEQALVWFRYYDQKSGASDTGHLRRMAICLARLGQVEEAVEKLTVYYRKKDGTFYDGYYRSLIEAYHAVDHKEKIRETLQRWYQGIEKEKKGWTFLVPKSKRPAVNQEDLADYYSCAGWQDLQDGDAESALANFEKQFQTSLGNGAGGNKDTKEGLDDIILTSILYKREKVGREYAKKLKVWLNRASFKAVDEYHDRGKARLLLEFLANYYTADEEELQAIVDRDEKCAVCSFCLMPRCQESIAARVLLLLKQGRREEALTLLEETGRVQPYDDYVIAIRKALQRENANS